MFENREVELLSLLPNMNSTDPDSLEWIALLGRLKRRMQDGPDSPDVRGIVRRMDEKRLEVFEDEDPFIDKLWEIRKSPAQSEKMGLYPIEDALLHFMEQAFEIYVLRKDKEQVEVGRHLDVGTAALHWSLIPLGHAESSNGWRNGVFALDRTGQANPAFIHLFIHSGRLLLPGRVRLCWVWMPFCNP